jgi:hypothetical protein
MGSGLEYHLGSGQSLSVRCCLLCASTDSAGCWSLTPCIAFNKQTNKSLAQPLPGGLMVVPTLLSADPTCRFIRVGNLSLEDQFHGLLSPFCMPSHPLTATTAPRSLQGSRNWWSLRRPTLLSQPRSPRPLPPALTLTAPAANASASKLCSLDMVPRVLLSPWKLIFQ